MRLYKTMVACSMLVMIAYSQVGHSANLSMDLSECSLTKLRNGPNKIQVESRMTNLERSSDWDRLPDGLGENAGGKVRPESKMERDLTALQYLQTKCLLDKGQSNPQAFFPALRIFDKSEKEQCDRMFQSIKNNHTNRDLYYNEYNAEQKRMYAPCLILDTQHGPGHDIVYGMGRLVPGRHPPVVVDESMSSETFKKRAESILRELKAPSDALNTRKSNNSSPPDNKEAEAAAR